MNAPRLSGTWQRGASPIRRLLAAVTERLFGRRAGSLPGEPVPRKCPPSMRSDWIGALPACPDGIPYEQLYLMSRLMDRQSGGSDPVDEAERSAFRHRDTVERH